MLNGFASYMAIYPEDDLYVIVLSNIQTGLLTELGIGLAGIALGKEVQPVTLPPKRDYWNGDYRHWLGRWKHEHIGTFTLVARDNMLYQTWGVSEHGSYVFANGSGRAFNRQENAAMELNGNVIRISWGGSDEEEFRRER